MRRWGKKGTYKDTKKRERRGRGGGGGVSERDRDRTRAVKNGRKSEDGRQT